mmetsp:Transcript_14949/g.26871  ORF Transcript_14949/g.26871 Transcript_14949/m.26871 type:complete len:311 (+) Transcript_14949:79-1011(+)
MSDLDAAPESSPTRTAAPADVKNVDDETHKKDAGDEEHENTISEIKRTAEGHKVFIAKKAVRQLAIWDRDGFSLFEERDSKSSAEDERLRDEARKTMDVIIQLSLDCCKDNQQLKQKIEALAHASNLQRKEDVANLKKTLINVLAAFAVGFTTSGENRDLMDEISRIPRDHDDPLKEIKEFKRNYETLRQGQERGDVGIEDYRRLIKSCDNIIELSSDSHCDAIYFPNQWNNAMKSVRRDIIRGLWVFTLVAIPFNTHVFRWLKTGSNNPYSGLNVLSLAVSNLILLQSSSFIVNDCLDLISYLFHYGTS